MRALFAKFATAILGAGLMMTATAALACNTGCAPPAPPTRPTPPTPPSMPCNCSNDHNHNNTNTNVNVNVKANVNVNASASSSAFSFGGASAASYGGGYGNWSQTPGVPENAGGLAVDTGEAAMDMIAEKRTITRTIVIQASCIDDTGVPHPASQLSPERAIANEYMGEVYRCIAGTHMSVTMADFGICDDFGGAAGDVRMSERESSTYSRQESHMESRSGSTYDSGYTSQGADAREGSMAGPCAPQAVACSAGGYESHGGGYASGQSSETHMVATGARRAGCGANMDLSHINFDGGKTMTCQKGDALWFEHGNLTCKAQIPQRQCNERSLLRRFGAGLKVLTVTRIETMKRQVARQVERSSSSTVMTFDGGVGGFVE